jgi:DNA polymerase-1
MVEAPPKEAPRLFLIDAYALIYRAFFAFISRPLTNSRGENTSAPFGFANFLLSIRENHQPDYLAIVFDKGMSKREEVYPEYKATRDKMPEELAASLPRIREMVEGFHDPVVEVDGYEADDVIGTLALQAREAGLEAVIVSGDKDLYQLVGAGIHLLNPGRGGPTGVEPEWVDESNAHEKFGIPPERIPDYLALIGDSSDNVPGAPGIGPKTAVKLLQEYQDLEDILAHAQEIPGKRARESSKPMFPSSWIWRSCGCRSPTGRDSGNSSSSWNSTAWPSGSPALGRRGEVRGLPGLRRKSPSPTPWSETSKRWRSW